MNKETNRYVPTLTKFGEEKEDLEEGDGFEGVTSKEAFEYSQKVLKMYADAEEKWKSRKKRLTNILKNGVELADDPGDESIIFSIAADLRKLPMSKNKKKSITTQLKKSKVFEEESKEDLSLEEYTLPLSHQKINPTDKFSPIKEYFRSELTAKVFQEESKRQLPLKEYPPPLSHKRDNPNDTVPFTTYDTNIHQAQKKSFSPQAPKFESSGQEKSLISLTNSSIRRRRTSLRTEGSTNDPKEQNNEHVNESANNEEESDTKKMKTMKLSKDTYSFLIISSKKDSSFYLGLFIAIFQAFMYGCTFWFKIPHGIPKSVPLSLRCGQFLSLIINLVIHDDILNTIIMMSKGYPKSLQNAAPNSSRGKFFMSYLVQLFIGIAGFGVGISIILQSEDPTNILAKFTSFGIISKIDDLFFSAGSKGFLNKGIEDECKKAENVRFEWREKRGAKRMSLAFLFTIEFACWLAVLLMQETRVYYCHNINVVVDNVHTEPRCMMLTGNYQLDRNESENSRPVYKNYNGVELKYKKGAWHIGNIEDHHCDLWSEKTKVYDPSEAAELNWYSFGSFSKIETKPDFFKMTCVDCDNLNPCHNGGNCVDNRVCQCNNDGKGTFIGNKCDYDTSQCLTVLEKYPDDCDVDEVDRKFCFRTAAFEQISDDGSKHEPNKKAMVHNGRPVFKGTKIDDSNSGNKKKYDDYYMFFMGKRWIQFRANRTTMIEAVKDMENSTMSWENLESIFISSKVFITSGVEGTDALNFPRSMEQYVSAVPKIVWFKEGRRLNQRDLRPGDLDDRKKAVCHKELRGNWDSFSWSDFRSDSSNDDDFYTDDFYTGFELENVTPDQSDIPKSSPTEKASATPTARSQ